MEKASSLLRDNCVSMNKAGASGGSYPAKVSASKVERWSYSMGTMGICSCPSGPVTVWMGFAQDMLIVSKPSMAHARAHVAAVESSAGAAVVARGIGRRWRGGWRQAGRVGGGQWSRGVGCRSRSVSCQRGRGWYGG